MIPAPPHAMEVEPLGAELTQERLFSCVNNKETSNISMIPAPPHAMEVEPLGTELTQERLFWNASLSLYNYCKVGEWNGTQ